MNGLGVFLVEGNTMKENVDGLNIAENSYVFMPNFSPNTIQDNDIGVHCDAGGVISVGVAQVFNGNTSDGVIFNCVVRGLPLP